ncbi:MAG: hypothetical protein RBQ77_03605 [Candidatus Methanomethylophilaceae archaeon]|jgi:hypothetical protein|nr:hypothetical protein [Candidatus Methanomethylophilaceae archaeon]
MVNECNVRVDAGVCKMITTIHAKQNDMGLVELDVKSDCPNILRMTWIMEPVSPYTEVEAPMNETVIYKWASERLPHAACPVPCALVKAVEVAGDLGLKRAVKIEIE